MTEAIDISHPPAPAGQIPPPNRVRDLYTSRVQAARTRFATNTALSAVLNPEIDEAVLELFLIYFNALGVSMTEPVEDWICRAGERCQAIGLAELGRSLRAHARQEAGHHLMMIEDTRTLVAGWNARRTPTLDADLILGQPATDGVRLYRKLHEEVIAGDAPFGQLAIEFEIERLSVVFGPQLIERCKELLGPAVLSRLSFLEEHVRIDVGHTRFNERQLEKLLEVNPAFVTPLVRAGEGALEAYAAFLNDCLSLAGAVKGGAR